MLGLFVVPVIPAGFFLIGGGAFDPGQWAPIWLWLVSAYLFPTLFIGVLGVPSFLLLQRLNLVRWWTTAVLGFCIGIVFAVVTRSPKFVSVREVLQCGAVGTLTAVAFWVIWLGHDIRRRKDERAADRSS